MKALMLARGLLLGVVCANQTWAADRTFTVATNAALVNHWPAADGFIGTADDSVTADLSTYVRSSPNQAGSYSFLVTTLGQSPADPSLFGTYNTITYLIGSVTIDPTQFVSADVPLLKSLEFSGTELFPGHGAYTVKFASRRGGSTTRSGHVFQVSVQYDFQGTFVAGTATGTNATAVGPLVLLDAADYDAPNLSGAPDALATYLKTVAIPLARSRNATGLICGGLNLQTSGSVPGIPGDTGYFPPLTAYGVVLGLELSAPPAGEIKITSVALTPSGLTIQWSPLTGQTYTVQAADALGAGFNALASNLSQAQYTDAASLNQRSRFYRVRAP